MTFEEYLLQQMPDKEIDINLHLSFRGSEGVALLIADKTFYVSGNVISDSPPAGN